MVLCSQQMTGMYTNHRIDRDDHWQQLGTQPILISTPQWANRPCNAPTRLYRVGKKPSVKADLVIYSHTVDVHGQCMSESLTLEHNLDFSSCAGDTVHMVGFCKSSHIYAQWHISNSSVLLLTLMQLTLPVHLYLFCVLSTHACFLCQK